MPLNSKNFKRPRPKQKGKAPATEAGFTKDRRIESMQQGLELGCADQLPLQIKRSNKNVFTTAQAVNKAFFISAAVAGVEVDRVDTFTINDLDGATSLLAVFDQYRIIQVSLTFLPRYSETVSQGTSATQLGFMLSVLDYDDNTNLGSAALRQYESAVQVQSTKPMTRTLVPHIATAAYSGAFTSFANQKMIWIDSGSPTVQHYGVKSALINCQVVSQTIYDVQARYVVQFRNTI